MSHYLLKVLFLERDREAEYEAIIGFGVPPSEKCLMSFAENLIEIDKEAKKRNLYLDSKVIMLVSAAKHIKRRRKFIQEYYEESCTPAVANNNGTKYGDSTLRASLIKYPVYCAIAGSYLTNRERCLLVPSLALLLNMHFKLDEAECGDDELRVLSNAGRAVRKLSHVDNIYLAEIIKTDIHDLENLKSILKNHRTLNRDQNFDEEEQRDIDDILTSLLHAIEVIFYKKKIIKRSFGKRSNLPRYERGTSGFRKIEARLKTYNEHGQIIFAQTNGEDNDENQYSEIDYDITQTPSKIRKIIDAERKRALRKVSNSEWSHIEDVKNINWNSMLPYEANLKFGFREGHELALQLLLSILLSVNPNEVLTMIVSDDPVKNEKDQLDRLIYHCKIGRISKSIDGNLNSSPKIQGTIDRYCQNVRWNIQLTPEIKKLIDYYSDKNNSKGRVFNVIDEKSKALSVSNLVSRRVVDNLSNIASIFYRHKLDCGPISSAFLAGKSNSAVGAASYYWSVSEKNIIKANNQLCAWILGNEIPEFIWSNSRVSHKRYGSQRVAFDYSIKQSYIKISSSMHSGGRPPNCREKLIRFHNNYMSYIVFVLLLSTGVRLNKSLNESFISYSSITQMIELDDKEVTENYTRIVPVSRLLIAQLEHYKDHVELIKKKLVLIGSKNKYDFFFLDKNSNKIDVKADSYESFMFGKVQLVSNFSRHYLVSLMVDKQVPDCYLLMFLGHRRFGLEYDQLHSSICPSLYKTTILDVISDLYREIGINRALKGLSHG